MNKLKNIYLRDNNKERGIKQNSSFSNNKVVDEGDSIEDATGKSQANVPPSVAFY